MSCPSNLNFMSSKFIFPVQFPNLTNTNSNTNTNSSNNSSPISSRSSTPSSESSRTSHNSHTSYNSNNARGNNLSDENEELKRINSSLTLENMKLKLEISKLKADMCINELNNSLVQQKDYYMNEFKKYESLYRKISRKREELKRSLDDERKKKRKYIHILYEFGLSNKTIRKDMGDFEYSAELRKYAVPKVTRVRNDIEKYNIGDRVGRKCFEFTNSSDLKLYINDLKLVNPNNPKDFIKCSIEKLDSSFGCIYDEDNSNDYHYHNKSNSYNSRKVISKNGYDYQKINKYNDYNCTNIINPDDHFLIRFEHPIIQKEGSYKLSYRLHSKIKANTPRYKGNGTFGQKIEFEYKVSKY